MKNEALNGNFAKPPIIPFSGEWKLLEYKKPVGFRDVLCILSNHAVLPMKFSDLLLENNGFFQICNDYSFDQNPVIYWTYMLDCPVIIQNNEIEDDYENPEPDYYTCMCCGNVQQLSIDCNRCSGPVVGKFL